MMLGCNPHIFFVTFLQFELSHFFAQLPKRIDTGYFVNATPPTILALSS